jgi:hypothetical protein
MKTIDEQLNIPTALALEFEGRALEAGMTSEKYLKLLMNSGVHQGVTTTRTQREIERHVLKGYTDLETAKEVGCTRHYVIQVRNKLGLPPNK